MLPTLRSLLPACALGIAATLAPAQDRRPNVILIYADDQGSVDAGCYGSEDLATPALDTLAAGGLRFTQFYAPASVCSPSRAGMLTGRYPWTVGMPGNSTPPPPESIDDLDELRGERHPFADAITIAERFRAAGYATGHAGKWHLGHLPGSRPLDQGFESSFGHLGGCIDNYSHTFFWDGPNRHDLWRGNERVHRPGVFFPDLLFEEARRFVDAERDRPFFLYLALNLPHYPYQGDPKWLTRYAALPYPRNLYAAFLSTLDERLGRFLTHLDESGLTENTIVVYQSDNGHSVEVRAHHGGGSNGPYRGAKFSLFEGGLRLPALIAWRGHLPAGEVRDQVAHGCDWLPTLAELCEIELPDRAELDGKSLVPVLRSAAAPTPHEHLFWRGGAKRYAVRSGPWKLVVDPSAADDDGPPLDAEARRGFLVNLDEDPGETRQRAGDQPEVLRRLRALAASAGLDG